MLEQGKITSPTDDLLQLSSAKFKYLKPMERHLLGKAEGSIITYFKGQTQLVIAAFTLFVIVVLIAMLLFATYGVNYLLNNLVAIKFILNFIPGQWLLENKEAFELKDLDI